MVSWNVLKKEDETGPSNSRTERIRADTEPDHVAEWGWGCLQQFVPTP
jgi:hypothetical protein